MKARIPLMIFEAEDYKDLQAYSQIMVEDVVLNLEITFPNLNIYNYSISVEQTKIDADINTMLKIKREQLEKLKCDIKFLTQKIQDMEKE